MAWGLMDEEISMTSVGESDPSDLAEAYGPPDRDRVAVPATRTSRRIASRACQSQGFRRGRPKQAARPEWACCWPRASRL
jgi:hypothetical protein